MTSVSLLQIVLSATGKNPKVKGAGVGKGAKIGGIPLKTENGTAKLDKTAFRSILANALNAKKSSFSNENVDGSIILSLLKMIIDLLNPQLDLIDSPSGFGGKAKSKIEVSGASLSTVKATRNPTTNVTPGIVDPLTSKWIELEEIFSNPTGMRAPLDTVPLSKLVEHLKSGNPLTIRVGDTVITLKLKEGADLELDRSSPSPGKAQRTQNGIRKSVAFSRFSQTEVQRTSAGRSKPLVLEITIEREVDSKGYNDQAGFPRRFKVFLQSNEFPSKSREMRSHVLPGTPSKDRPILGTATVITDGTNKGELRHEFEKALPRLMNDHVEFLGRSQEKAKKTVEIREKDGGGIDLKSLRPLMGSGDSKPGVPSRKVTKTMENLENTITSGGRGNGNGEVEGTVTDPKIPPKQHVHSTQKIIRTQEEADGVGNAKTTVIVERAGQTIEMGKVKELLKRFADLKLRSLRITPKKVVSTFVTSRPIRSSMDAKNTEFMRVSAKKVYHELPSRSNFSSGDSPKDGMRSAIEQNTSPSQDDRTREPRSLNAERVHPAKDGSDGSGTSAISNQVQHSSDPHSRVETVEVSSLTRRIQNAVKNALMGGNSTISMRFQLVPKGLGQVEIEIVREADKSYRVVFNVHRDDAREIVERSLPILRERLREEGIEHVRFEFTHGREDWNQERFAEGDAEGGQEQRGAYRRRHSNFKAFLKEVTGDAQRGG